VITRVNTTAVASLLVGALGIGSVAMAGGGFTPGSVGIGDPYVPGEGNGGYQVRSYDLDLRFNPDTDRLRGIARIEATATQSLSAFNLDLYGLMVDRVRVDGADATFTRAPRELTVRPVTGIGDGSRFTVVVRYAGRPQTLNDPDLGKSGWFNTSDGAIVVGEPEAGMFWFPVNEHPSDKARMCTEITVPKGLRAVSTGLPERRPVTRHGWTTFRWCTRDPMASYLATVAIGTWRFDRSRTDSGIPVLNYVDRTLSRSVDRSLGRTAEIVDFFEKRFGNYPFESAGGIADNHVSYYALENQTRPTYDKKTVAWRGLTGTVAHEIAHQWYGDSVALERWRDIWLNEGFATYGEWLWKEHVGGATVEQRFDEVFSIPARNSFWTLNISDPGYANLFDSPIYYRGAMTLHALELKVGASDFARILRAWAARHANGNARTNDFIRLSERVSGRNLEPFFTAWLVDGVKPADPR
jgi:aminopeptidase N